MKYLIVTADDFGLTRSINEGIIKAVKEGVVTNASAMPTGEAFDDAARCAEGIGLKDIGAHLSLTGTVPLSDLDKIPSLITKNGKFYKDHNIFFLNYMAGRIKRDHIYIELKRQLDELENKGFEVTNLATHEHIHMIPGIMGILIRLAEEHDIPAIRHPHGERLRRRLEFRALIRYLILSSFESGMAEKMKGHRVKCTDHFAGFLDSGRIDEEVLMQIIKFLKDGTTELVCHPGFLSPEVLERYIFHINGENELFALISRRVKKLIEDKGIKLITYREFLNNPSA